MLSRRELLGYSAVIALGFSGLSFGKKPSFERLLDTKPYGNVSLVFTSDIHGHLKPVYFPEPMNLIAPENLRGTPGCLVGMDFLRYYNPSPTPWKPTL
jgi:sulfur-oxidizing protein SoxB